MLKWNVKPLVSVEEITFGMERKKIRLIMGEPVREYRKSAFSDTVSDDYGYCHVFYDLSDKCVAIEIFTDVTVLVDGNIVFPDSLDGFKSVFTNIEEVEGGYIIPELSVGLYAPDGKMESILFGEEGYYK